MNKTYCMCGCGESPRMPGSRFVQGHDARLRSILKDDVENAQALVGAALKRAAATFVFSQAV